MEIIIIGQLKLNIICSADIISIIDIIKQFTYFYCCVREM